MLSWCAYSSNDADSDGGAEGSGDDGVVTVMMIVMMEMIEVVMRQR